MIYHGLYKGGVVSLSSTVEINSLSICPSLYHFFSTYLFQSLYSCLSFFLSIFYSLKLLFSSSFFTHLLLLFLSNFFCGHGTTKIRNILWLNITLRQRQAPWQCDALSMSNILYNIVKCSPYFYWTQ